MMTHNVCTYMYILVPSPPLSSPLLPSPPLSSPDQLIVLVEVLGSHSIMAAELKQLIGALRSTEDGYLPSYYYKLQQMLCTTAHLKEGITPLYYFDLRGPSSCIHIPSLQQWPSTGGFSFHAWVRLDHASTLQIQESPATPTKHRRMLYR